MLNKRPINATIVVKEVKKLIRNRLSVLLAERNLKITRVSKDTGIARSTITSIAQNEVKMIQLETINSMCIYLGITPCEFFEFSEYDVSFNVYCEEKRNPDDIYTEFLEIIAYMDFVKGNKKYSLEFLGSVTKTGGVNDSFNYDGVNTTFKLQDNEDYKVIKDDISVTFWADIIKNFSTYISDVCNADHNALFLPSFINIDFE